MAQRIRWLRVGIEGAVIVGSILMAFGIEAWWAEHRQRVDQEEALESLRADLVATGDVLRRRARGMGYAYGASEILLSQLRGGAERSETVTVSDSLIVWSIMSTVLEVHTATLEGLVASGGLSLLEDPTLEVGLRLWPQQVAFTKERTNEAQRVVWEVLLPALLESGDVSRALQYANNQILGRGSPSGSSELVASPRLQGAIAARLLALTVMQVAITNLTEDTDELVSALNAR